MYPRTYRWLLLTYPSKWRAQNADVVLDTLLAVHADTGRGAPSFVERVQFAVDGLRVRLSRPQHVVFRLVPLGVFSTVHRFDQSNDVLPPDAIVDELSQTRANSEEFRNSDELRVAALAYAGMNMQR